MNFQNFADKYENLARELDTILAEAEARITSGLPDEYFVRNVNFFTKSFLISLCCYLEAFLKEIANSHVALAQQRLLEAKIPRNLIGWSLKKNLPEKEMQFNQFSLNITKKEIDDELSGNPFRTANCFKLLGIDLNSIAEFNDKKEIINAVVAKRNDIIHHNDTAASISLGDIRSYSAHFISYARTISTAAQKVNEI